MDTTSISDSAGIAIVQNPKPGQKHALNWVIDSVPSVRIGGVAGEGPYQFGDVRDVVRLSDGRIAVLDAKVGEVRLFGSDGKFLSKFGRTGKGPGEVEGPSKIFRIAGDSLLVIDRDGTNTQLFATNGAHVRSDPIATTKTQAGRPRGIAQRVALFADGSYLMEQSLLSAIHIEELGGGAFRPSQRLGAYDDSAAFSRASPAGELLAEYGNLVVGRIHGTMLHEGQPSSITLFPEYFWEVAGDRFLIADAVSSQLRVYSPTGKLSTIVRIPVDRVRLQLSMFVRATGGDTTSPEERRAEAEFAEALRAVQLPTHFPAFSWVLMDQGGDIWIRPFIPRDLNEQARAIRTWWVLDPKGVLRGIVTAPAAFLAPEHFDVRTTEFGADYILAVRRDANDVQEVQLYRLRRQ